jgi:hypothetical protein
VTRSASGSASALRLIEPDFWTCPHGVRQRPAKVETFGPEVASVCADAGYGPDPQQELALDLIFAVRADGKSASFEVCLICARQNLKTGTFLQSVIGWLLVLDVREVMWSAHELATSAGSQRTMARLFRTSPTLSKHLLPQKNDGVYDENGDERIELARDRVCRFRTRTKDGMRGLQDVEKLIVDEGFALAARQMGAIYPVLGAKPDPQILIGSSAGPIEALELRRIRDRGRAGTSRRLTYLEWGAPWEPCRDRDGEIDLECRHLQNSKDLGLDCALDREDLLLKANPTISTGRMSLETIQDFRDSMPPEEFMRECLTWWEDPQSTLSSVFGPGRWDSCKAKSAAFPLRPTAIGVAVSEDRTWSSIAAATIVEIPDPSGDGVLEVPYIAAVARREGVGWLPDEVARIQAETDCMVLVDEKGPASNLVEDLEDADAAVEPVSVNDYANACSSFYDAVRERRIVHGATTELDEAVAGAEWRPMGDRKVWGRRNSTTDVSMLEAATLAVHGAGDGAFTIH